MKKCECARAWRESQLRGRGAGVQLRIVIILDSKMRIRILKDSFESVLDSKDSGFGIFVSPLNLTLAGAAVS